MVHNEKKPLTMEDVSLMLEQQEKKIKQLENRLDEHLPQDMLSMIVFSNDFDKALAAFIIATGAATMGLEVNLFFTFWATSILRKTDKKVDGKKIMEKMFEIMLPNGSNDLSLSQMNMMGIGTKMMKKIMKNNNVTSLEDLIMLVKEMDININICEMSMSLMGLKKEELVFADSCQICGIANYIATARKSKITLFI